MSESYIPAADGAFDAWAANFATLIGNDPHSYGLEPADALRIGDAQTDWRTAYLTATTPETRTSPAIAAKDASRRTLEAVVRPYAIDIRNNQGVTDEQRADLGLTIPKTVPTPIPAPTSAPAIALRQSNPGVIVMSYSDTANPEGKAKPYGVIGVELWASIGTEAATSPEQCRYVGTRTKSPMRLATQAADAGKTVTLFARYTTRSGPGGVAQTGPWSSRLVTSAI
jgi:hypothetical protein